MTTLSSGTNVLLIVCTLLSPSHHLPGISSQQMSLFNLYCLINFFSNAVLMVTNHFKMIINNKQKLDYIWYFTLGIKIRKGVKW